MIFNDEFQPPTRWEPFVAATMLRLPDPTKEPVKPTSVRTTAIAIPLATRFTLQFRIQGYMWRRPNNFTTCVTRPLIQKSKSVCQVWLQGDSVTISIVLQNE